MLTIISGGQTGADRTALEIARELGLPTGGTAPAGWQTDEGPDPTLADFGLRTCAFGYRVRTRMNVNAADGTVWFGATNSPGARATLRACADYGKPHLVNPDVGCLVATLLAWRPAILNIAGNRRRTNPAIVQQVREVLAPALVRYLDTPLDSTPGEEVDETGAAIGQADAHANDAWRELARGAVYRVAQQLEWFNSEDVWRDIQTQASTAVTHDHRAMGPVMLYARRCGWIEKVDATRPAQQMAHNRPMQIWRSLIYGAPD